MLTFESLWPIQKIVWAMLYQDLKEPHKNITKLWTLSWAVNTPTGNLGPFGSIGAVVQLGRAEIMLGNPKIKMGVALYRWMVCNGKSIQNWMIYPCRKPPCGFKQPTHDSDSSETWRIRKECFWCPTLSTWFTTRLTMFLVIYSIPTSWSLSNGHYQPVGLHLSTNIPKKKNHGQKPHWECWHLIYLNTAFDTIRNFPTFRGLEDVGRIPPLKQK